MAAGVVAEAGPRLGFRHGLIRQVLYEGMPGPRCGRRCTAGGPRAGGGRRGGGAGGRAARRGPEAGGEWVWAWLAGAAGVLASQAPQVAAQLLRGGLAQIPDADPRREVLGATLVSVAFLLMQHEEVERVGRPLLARTTDPDRAGEVAWLLGYTLSSTRRRSEAAAVVEDALARPGISATWTARLRARQAVTMTMLEQWDRSADLGGAGAGRRGARR